jgi:hypothetical protein
MEIEFHIHIKLVIRFSTVMIPPRGAFRAAGVHPN